MPLQEKQKLRHMYGIIERQFRITVSTALANLKVYMVKTSWFFLNHVLTTYVYRLGLARTRRQARQLVNHGHITVDGSARRHSILQSVSWTNNLSS